MATVQTVRGPIDSAELGVTRTHEHLLCDVEFHPGRWSYDVLDDEELSTRELRRWADVGGRSIVDPTLHDIGRDPVALRRISEATGVHIVMGSGWYRQPYYKADIDQTPTRELAAQLIREIEEGVGDTGIRPGIIGEIGSHKGRVTAQEERVFRACARAARETGLAVTTHSIYRAGLEHVAIMREEGLDPERIVIGHCDAQLQIDLHRAIASQGATVEFDQIGMYPGSAWWEERLAEIIAALVAEGYGGQILLSTDICKRSHLEAYGGVGFAYLFTVFLPKLRRHLDQAAIDRILVDNPRRILEPRGRA